METMTDILGRIREFVVTNFYVPEQDRLTDDASLLEAGIVDSTGVCEVIAFLRKAFGIEVDDREVVPENLDTIAAIAGLVARKMR